MITTMEESIINMTMDYLDSLEKRIIDKQETVEDYKNLESLLVQNGLPIGYLLASANREEIFSFEELNRFRKNPPEPRDPFKIGRVTGILTGLIGFLKTKL